MRMWRQICLCSGIATLLAVAFVLEGCGGGSTTATPVEDPPDDPAPAFVHQDVVLRNRLGQPIALGSNEPYSPRTTCAGCHDFHTITNGYHFQQGRTDASGTIQMANDFFGDGRPWLKSDGMYGKW
ncbi:MAG: hypothetical protein QNJ90_00645 [Planctomycetota bacterium]|nr:hypothetical protein [Planctomycetota bacterium]